MRVHQWFLPKFASGFYLVEHIRHHQIFASFSTNTAQSLPKLVVLENLSPYLFMHMKNVQIESHTRPMHQFEGKVVLNLEVDLKSGSAISIWIGSPP
jgi:hypothetical protein